MPILGLNPTQGRSFSLKKGALHVVELYAFTLHIMAFMTHAHTPKIGTVGTLYQCQSISRL